MIKICDNNLTLEGPIWKLLGESTEIVASIAYIFRYKGGDDIPKEVREESLKNYVDMLINVCYGEGDTVQEMLNSGIQEMENLEGEEL